VLLVYSLFLTWGGLTLLPFGVSTLCWLCMDVTTKERLGAKPRIGTRHRVNTRMKRIKKKSGLGDETDGDGDRASPRQVWVGDGEGGNDTDDAEDESTLMGMGSAAFIPGYPPPHPDLIWCVSPRRYLTPFRILKYPITDQSLTNHVPIAQVVGQRQAGSRRKAVCGG
jgi:hypothetical protein